MKIDKQEKRWWNKKKFQHVNSIIDEEFKNVPKRKGLCYEIWARKKQLLKELYSIEWRSPADLNPGTMFD